MFARRKYYAHAPPTHSSAKSAPLHTHPLMPILPTLDLYAQSHLHTVDCSAKSALLYTPPCTLPLMPSLHTLTGSLLQPWPRPATKCRMESNCHLRLRLRLHLSLRLRFSRHLWCCCTPAPQPLVPVPARRLPPATLLPGSHRGGAAMCGRCSGRGSEAGGVREGQSRRGRGRGRGAVAGTGCIRAEYFRPWAQRMDGAAATGLGLLQDHSDRGE